MMTRLRFDTGDEGRPDFALLMTRALERAGVLPAGASARLEQSLLHAGQMSFVDAAIASHTQLQPARTPPVISRPTGYRR